MALMDDIKSSEDPPILDKSIDMKFYQNVSPVPSHTGK